MSRRVDGDLTCPFAAPAASKVRVIVEIRSIVEARDCDDDRDIR
jgi:hypothetical protein